MEVELLVILRNRRNYIMANFAMYPVYKISTRVLQINDGLRM
jgi:hypothetical protein